MARDDQGISQKVFSNSQEQYAENEHNEFCLKENETFCQCWKMLNEVLLACPHYGYETWRVISFFYDGLSSSMRQLVEMMCNCEFMSKARD
jgi:hypothetical protein